MHIWVCVLVFFFFVCVNVNFYFTGVNNQQCNCWAIWRLCRYMGLFLNPQLFSPDLFVFFTLVPHYLHCCCFVLSFQNRNTNPVLFFKNNLFHFLLIFLCIYVYTHICGYAVRRLEDNFQGLELNSGHQTWQEVPLPAMPSGLTYFILH